MVRRKKAHDPVDGQFVPDNPETPNFNEHYEVEEPKPEVRGVARLGSPEAPEAPEAIETPGVQTPVTPKLRPEDTAEGKTKEVAARDNLDLNSGQRFGAKLIALAEMNRRK